MPRFVIFKLIFFLLPLLATAEERRVVPIGALFSLSGWAAVGGTPEYRGVLLAVDEINNDASFPIKIDLHAEDATSDLVKTVSAYRKLVSVDKVQAVVGPNWAEFTEVVAPLALSTHTVTVTPSGHQEHLFEKPSEFLFTLFPGQKVEEEPLGAYIISKGYKKIAIVRSHNAYYEEVQKALTSIVSPHGVVFEPIFDFPAEENDFRTAITKISHTHVDAFLSLLVENIHMHAFLVQLQQQHLTPPHLNGGTGIFYDEEVKKNLSLAEGAVALDYKKPTDQKFIEAYRKKFQSDPPAWSDRGYDALMVLAHALAKCKGTLSDCVKASDFIGASGPLSFSENGVRKVTEPFTQLWIIENGKRKLLDTPTVQLTN